jgi:uncharacterized phiE125 gp8 family phage protein
MPVRIIAPVTGALQPVSLEEARAQTRVDCEDEDALITSLASVATQAASDRLQRALVPTRYRLTLDSFPSAIELLMPPIISVESVKYIDINGDQQTLDPQDYFLDSVSGVPLDPSLVLKASREEVHEFRTVELFLENFVSFVIRIQHTTTVIFLTVFHSFFNVTNRKRLNWITCHVFD